jgi:hypothetical protein
MSVHKKLMEARIKLAGSDLKKTGENKFAGYKYFELGDFLPTAQAIFNELGLCGIVSFTRDIATLTITCVDGGGELSLTSPMGSAALKGCHEVQNIGAVETYQRRYLWVSAFEIVEHDALDATTGKSAPVKKVTPTDGAWDSMSEEAQAWLQDHADHIISLGADRAEDISEYLTSLNLASEEKIALWTRLDSKIRAAIKKQGEKK